MRLLLGSILVGLIILPLYFFLLDRSGDGAIEPAQLLDAPPVAGRSLGTGIEAGKLAPDFEISTPEGERVRLSDLRGRPIVMNFWARWCTSCLSEMPEIKALQEERGLDSVTVLAINAGETPAQAQEFIDFLEAPFVYGLDTDLTVSDAYGVYGLPLSVFIDSEGVIQATYIGHANRKNLETLTDAAIQARPAGEIPAVLRVVSSIYRERVLMIESKGESQVVFQSRSLRCDSSYCANPTVDELRATPGIRSAELDIPASRLTVTFDPAALNADEVAERLAALLAALTDPVYLAELVIKDDSAG